jgi:hypothetical protein
MPMLLAANWREPPRSQSFMENVILMSLDILPQAKGLAEFGRQHNDIPPLKIPFLIDNWSSTILDFEIAASPAEVVDSLPARAYLGMAERHQSKHKNCSRRAVH